MKKRAREDDRVLALASRQPKLLFQLILPYLFPGLYDCAWLAFRTYLSLSQTCCTMRYWNWLRRWIGYLTPLNLRTKMRSHGFFCPVDNIRAFEREVLRIKKSYTLMAVNEADMLFASGSTAAQWSGMTCDSNFERNIGGSPFYNMTYLFPFHVADLPTLCFLAPSFAEMVLFCYNVIAFPAQTYNYIVAAEWKTGVEPSYLYFSGNDIESSSRIILGRLRRFALTAPLDVGFHSGSMPITSQIWFDQTCNTNRTKNSRSPTERLGDFVRGWFHMEPFPNRGWSVAPKWAYEIEMNFES